MSIIYLLKEILQARKTVYLIAAQLCEERGGEYIGKFYFYT